MRHTFKERLTTFVESKHGRPTLAELKVQAEEALSAAEREDLGKLSREERNKILFGL